MTLSSRTLWMSLLIVSLAVPSLVGCTGNRNKKMTDLYANIHGFHQSMRHARYSQAGRVMASKIRGDFIGRYEERGDDYQIVEVDLDQVVMQGEGEYAEVTAIVRWIDVPDMVVQKEKIKEVWQYNGESWVMIHRKHEGVDDQELPSWKRPWLKAKDAKGDVEKTAESEQDSKNTSPTDAPKTKAPVHQVSEGPSAQ